MKGSMLIFFFERINTEENPFLLSLHQPRASHEYHLSILAMFTMSRKDVKHVNWLRLGVFGNVFGNVRSIGGAPLSCGFPMTL